MQQALRHRAYGLKVLSGLLAYRRSRCPRTSLPCGDELAEHSPERVLRCAVRVRRRQQEPAWTARSAGCARSPRACAHQPIPSTPLSFCLRHCSASLSHRVHPGSSWDASFKRVDLLAHTHVPHLEHQPAPPGDLLADAHAPPRIVRLACGMDCQSPDLCPCPSSTLASGRMRATCRKRLLQSCYARSANAHASQNACLQSLFVSLPRLAVECPCGLGTRCLGLFVRARTATNF